MSVAVISSEEGIQAIETALSRRTGKQWKCLRGIREFTIKEPTRIAGWRDSSGLAHIVNFITKDEFVTVFGSEYKPGNINLKDQEYTTYFTEADSELGKRIFNMSEVKRKVCL